MVVENTRSRVKIKPKLTNFKINSRIEGYNGKYESIHRELGKFLMIYSNLIKLDDGSMIEIRQFDI